MLEAAVAVCARVRRAPTPLRRAEAPLVRHGLVLVVVAVAGVLAPASALGDTLNLFEWLAVAPIVVSGESLGVDGPFHRFRVEQVLRGDSPAGGDVIRVDVRRANRDRDRELHPQAMKFDVGASYLLLVERLPPRGKPHASPPRFALVRGVEGARELPREGAAALLSAAARFTGLQDRKDHEATWRGFAEMLEETEPLLIETALDQFLKFRRGGVDQLATVRPLLDHPDPGLRERAARLIDQILRRRDAAQVLPDRARLIEELVARARRDGSIAVRVAATEALSAIRADGAWKVIEEIADDDPDQLVRYAAERLLYERRQATPRPPGGSGGR